MKTKTKLLNQIFLGIFLLSSVVMFAQTNTSPTQTVCAGSLAEPYLINPPTSGSTYQWTLSGGGILNLGTSSDNITVDWGMTPGTYTISVVETDINYGQLPQGINDEGDDMIGDYFEDNDIGYLPKRL